MKRFKENLICFLVGAVAYGLIELSFRGYTHWTMLVTGGTALLMLSLINRTPQIHILIRCMLGMIVITGLEFAVGMAVNVGMGWNVWDYSEKPLNLFGQICPQFSLCWFFLSIPAYGVCGYISRSLNSERYNF